MVKGKKNIKKFENRISSKKKLIQLNNETNNSNEEINNNDEKMNQSNYNFTITVYKLENGQYSLYNNSTSNLISNNNFNINSFQNYTHPNLISNTNIDIQIPIKVTNFNENAKKDNHPVNYSLNFKNKNFESKLRAKTEKNYRNSKNMKNLGKDGKDAISYKLYCDIEAGPSILPKKKYCDFTGLTSNYNELHTGIRYYNSQIYKMSQNIPQPIKDQYLNIRKALIRLK